jgi:hypothetical protein
MTSTTTSTRNTSYKVHTKRKPETFKQNRDNNTAAAVAKNAKGSSKSQGSNKPHTPAQKTSPQHAPTFNTIASQNKFAARPQLPISKQN